MMNEERRQVIKGTQLLVDLWYKELFELRGDLEYGYLKKSTQLEEYLWDQEKRFALFLDELINLKL